MVPGNPAEVMLGTYATPERLAAVSHEFGLDRPLIVRYGYWLKETVQGNLGEAGDVRHHAGHLGPGVLCRPDADRAVRGEVGPPARRGLRVVPDGSRREH